MDPILSAIRDNVVEGNKDETESQVRQALERKLPPDEILNSGLVAAMAEVGRRFESGDLFVPEMLVAARAMQTGLAILKPHLVQSGVKSRGVVVLGTIKGDMHDIGKNLVGMMLEGAGYEVVDLGTDVAPETFIAAAQKHQAALIGMSALLTTTMTNMKGAIAAFEDAGLRGKVKVIVGGAPLTDDFARSIGADGFAPDASRAVTLANSLVQ